MKHLPGIAQHARERMEEIHGRDLTTAEWLEVMLALIDRRSTLCSVQPNGSEIHAVEIAGLRIWVVYYSDRAVVVTVLPSSTPSFEAAYTRKAGTIRTVLKRDMHGTWHRGSKIKSSMMPNREMRGFDAAGLDEDGTE
jgi:hypothetical protein